MKQYRIYAGLGGSFGGAQEDGVYTFEGEDDAVDYAFERACEIFDSYSSRFDSVEDIMDYYGCDEDEAEEIFIEERERWIEYYVEEVV